MRMKTGLGSVSWQHTTYAVHLSANRWDRETQLRLTYGQVLLSQILLIEQQPGLGSHT